MILIGAIVFWALSNTPTSNPGGGNVTVWVVLMIAIAVIAITNSIFAKRLYRNPKSRAVMLRAVGIVSFIAIVGIFVLGIMPVISLSVEVIEQSVLGKIGHSLEWLVRPLGLDWRAVIALIAGFVAKELLISVFGTLGNFGEDDSGAIISTWYTIPAALGMMVFFNLYAPCLATIGAIKAEAGWKWMWFSIVYGIALGWIMAFVVYRVGTLFI